MFLNVFHSTVICYQGNNKIVNKPTPPPSAGNL